MRAKDRDLSLSSSMDLEGAHDNWKPQVEHFSRLYQVLTYDMRGHHQSEGEDGYYTCEMFADDLHALLNMLDIREPVVVCGLSL